MLRVTKLTDYATVLMTALAEAPARVHSAAELAERSRLEPTTVARVLKPLAHAGLVESFRGATGGYRLARGPAAISLFEIVEAMEGRLGMTECSGEHSNCEHEAHCGVQGPWRRINDVIAEALRGMSLAEMLPPPAPGRSARAIPMTLSQA
jgi:FeS assembly SUF system regulator